MGCGAANIRTVVKVLLAHGADMHARSDAWSQIEAVSPHGRPEYNRAIPYGSDTPLMFAARAGDLDSAKLLVAAGANVNDADAWGVSVMVLAAHSGFPDLVEFLLDKGADPNASGAGFTALHVAIMRRDEALVATLLAARRRPAAARSRTGRRPGGSRATTTSSPNWWARPRSGWRPASRSRAVMRLLVERGADPKFVHQSDRIVDGRGGKAYDASSGDDGTDGGGGHGRRRKRLGAPSSAASGKRSRSRPSGSRSSHGIDVNAANVDGRTALDAAKALKFERVATYLNGLGARPGITDKKNEPQP